ncbi:MAG: type IV secretory system conjugative DNA transfer family protein [Pseudomonadota bacterium]|nr:type IV secretory system conjugative DNA transfer family protein [Pseudomonadota bacterium]
MFPSCRPLKFLTAITLVSLLIGCSVPKEPTQAAKNQRIGLVRETAVSYASQYALYWEGRFLNDHMDRFSRTLDKIFDFRALLLPNGVVPPVLQESFKNVALRDRNNIRTSDRLIRIIAPSRFSTTSPSWRDYLSLNFPKPEYPVHTLLPKTSEERAAWDAGLVDGWNAGRWQASSIFQVNVGTLQRDFVGMVLYYKLLSQGMISPTHSAVANLGVTGNANVMQLNDRVVKITSKSELQPHKTNHWHAAVPVNAK